MTIREAQQKALLQLKILYDEREAVNITEWLIEHVTGKKRIDRLLDKEAILTTSQEVQFDEALQELATHKPIQYVTGEAWFTGMKFFVNKHVLIPRPETEELVEWIVSESQKLKAKGQKILDIGTGSGCIPVSLKKLLPEISVSSVDVSKEALTVAQKNADDLTADIQLLHFNFLDESNWDQLPVVDIIVSNPPYIKQSEHSSMSKNVLDFEPSIALFVPDEDALLFYRKIALFAKTHLTKDGCIFLEINEALGKEVKELYENAGYFFELRKDMQGKERMARVYHPR
jgi:release factor glutamine methyltransferase